MAPRERENKINIYVDMKMELSHSLHQDALNGLLLMWGESVSSRTTGPVQQIR
jgi:hypothetical protein